MFWLLTGLSGSILLTGYVYLRRTTPRASNRTDAYVKRRIRCALFRPTDSTDAIADRLLVWFDAHPPDECLLRDLSLLQQSTEQEGGVASYYAATVYGAALEAVSRSWTPAVKRVRSF
jgi:hypothetical protein